MLNLILLSSLLFCFLLPTYSQLVVTWKGDSGVSPSEFRHSNVFGWSLGLWSGGVFSSIEVTADNNSIEANAYWGSVNIGTGQFPWKSFAYFQSSAEFDSGSTNDWAKFSVQKSGGYMASSLLKIAEVDSSGAEVDSFLMKNVLWVYTGKTTVADGVYSFSFKGTKAIQFPGLEMNIVLVVTKEPGEATVNGATKRMEPTDVESFLEIKNYPYKDTANSLVLSIGVATGERSVEKERTIEIGSTTDGSTLYFSLDAHAMQGGSKKDVEVSAWTDVEFDKTFENSDLKSQLTGKYSSNYMAKVVEVTFQPGESSIVYDPTTGVTVSSPATTTATVSLVLLAFALCLSLFF